MKQKYMKFNVKCVKNELMTKGSVFTVRKTLGFQFTRNVKVNGIDCKKVPIIQRIKCKDDLIPYMCNSGFESIDEWWGKIREFNAENGTLFKLTYSPHWKCGGSKVHSVHAVASLRVSVLRFITSLSGVNHPHLKVWACPVRDMGNRLTRRH